MEYKLTFDDGSSGYLEHHGVKGMHWGVRNAETLARYQRDGLNLSYHGLESTMSSQAALGLKDDDPLTKQHAERLGSSSKSLMSRYNEHYSLASKALDDAAKDPSSKKEVVDALKKGFVSPAQVDDNDYLEMVAYDVASEVISKKAAKSPNGQKVTAYETEMNAWFSDAKKTTNDIVKKYGNKEIKVGLIGRGNNRKLSPAYPGNTYKTDYEKVVNHTLLSSADKFHSYAARHGIWEEALGNSGADTELAERALAEFRGDKVKIARR